LLPATGFVLLLEKTADAEVGKGAFHKQQNQTTHPSWCVLVKSWQYLMGSKEDRIEKSLGSWLKPVY